MNYEITSNTMAMQPYADSHYRTKIWDRDGIFFSTYSCTELLDTACLQTGSSSQGKRDAIKSLLSYKQNIPIPICYDRGICAIPSVSHQNWNCTWYFLAHIKHLKRHAKKKTYILFHNGEEILIDVSIHQTRMQILKAAHILTHFKLIMD